MNEHIVTSYEDELALLDKKIAHMGGLAERILGQAFDALERRDPKLAEVVVRSDKSIDALEREIEEQVVSMIARRQPRRHPHGRAVFRARPHRHRAH